MKSSEAEWSSTPNLALVTVGWNCLPNAFEDNTFNLGIEHVYMICRRVYMNFVAFYILSKVFLTKVLIKQLDP